jgi:hypothetical protein
MKKEKVATMSRPEVPITLPLVPSIKDESNNEPQPIVTPFKRIMKANALTGILGNKEFVKLVKSLEEGEYLLEIFGKAVENELETLFGSETKTRDKIIDLVGYIEMGYSKVRAIEQSAVLAVLERLMLNLSGQQPIQSQQTQQQRPYSEGQQPMRGEGIMGF